MDFLKEFKKSIEKIEGVTTNNEPPRYWFSTGNYVLNRVLSGSFHRGIPQGRITALAGPSTAGKSFLAANVIKRAQEEGAEIIILDSENALDKDFLSGIGVSDQGLHYFGVSTIGHVTKVVSKFISKYREEYGDIVDAPKILIVIDSLDQLMTDAELEKYEHGDTHADMGQHPKQLKQMLRTLTNDIKSLNISVIVTKQVYRANAQMLMQGEGAWIVNDAIRFSASLICLLTRLKLKDANKVVTGIRMKCEGFKTRFTKPFQTVVIEVPYEEGMDAYSGLIDVALELGVLTQRGTRLALDKDGTEITFFAKNFAEHAEYVVDKCEEQRKEFLSADYDYSQYEEDKDNEPARPRNKLKVAK